MSTYRFTICDVFTDRPLAGNQLAVFPDAHEIPEARLQPLAREINFSETVFAYPPGAGGDARIRIFTPRQELPFAGHPVLGSAFVLGAPLERDEIRLETSRGIVPVRLRREKRRITFGWMSQPIPSVATFEDKAPLLRAVGVERSLLPVEIYDNGVPHVFVTLETEDSVARLAPDFAALGRLFPDVGVNCFAGRERRWKTRMFAPGTGTAEDPATGSAAGPLAVHLVRHGQIPFGDEILIAQGAEIGRPSTLHARVEGRDGRVTRVEVGGEAVVVGQGEFSLP
jgi:trans-2,3-dihydro-3-hydroxyanthranilate isomerase